MPTAMPKFPHSRLIEQVAKQSSGKTDELLQVLIDEVRGLRADLKIAEIKRDPLYRTVEAELKKGKNHDHER